MTHPEDDAAYLLLIDRHIQELKQRLDDLRALIVDMVARDEDTASQSELFCTLPQAIESMKAIRVREIDAAPDDRPDASGLPRHIP
jgi:hypothetical protein